MPFYNAMPNPSHFPGATTLPPMMRFMSSNSVLYSAFSRAARGSYSYTGRDSGAYSPVKGRFNPKGISRKIVSLCMSASPSFSILGSIRTTPEVSLGSGAMRRHHNYQPESRQLQTPTSRGRCRLKNDHTPTLDLYDDKTEPGSFLFLVGDLIQISVRIDLGVLNSLMVSRCARFCLLFILRSCALQPEKKLITLHSEYLCGLIDSQLFYCRRNVPNILTIEKYKILAIIRWRFYVRTQMRITG